MTSPSSEPRSAEDLLCGRESAAEIEYAEFCEAEEAADRRFDLSPPDAWFLPEPKR